MERTLIKQGTVDLTDPEFIGFDGRSVCNPAFGVEEQLLDAISIHADAEQVVNDIEANEAGLLTRYHTRKIQIFDDSALTVFH